MCQPGWEGSLGENGYMYIYDSRQNAGGQGLDGMRDGKPLFYGDRVSACADGKALEMERGYGCTW